MILSLLLVLSSSAPILHDDLVYCMYDSMYADILCLFQHQLSSYMDVSFHVNQIPLWGISMQSGVLLDNTEIDTTFHR